MVWCVRPVAALRGTRPAGAAAWVLLLCLLGAGVAVAGDTSHRPAPGTTDATAWLESTGPGAASLVNGPSARAGATVTVPGTAGHRLTVNRDGREAYLADQDTNTIHRIDATHLTVGATARFRGPTSVVVAGPVVYMVSPLSPVVTEVDPSTLATRREVVVGTAPLGAFLGTADGTLWLLETELGVIRAIRGGKAILSTAVAFATNAVSLLPAGDRVLMVNRTAGRLASLSREGAIDRWADLPRDAVGEGLLVAPAPCATGTTPVALVDPVHRRLLLAGRATNVTVPLEPAIEPGGPVCYAGVVHIPDLRTGRLLRYAPASGRWLEPVTAIGPAAGMRVFVRGGLLWVNDPASAQAAVFDGQRVRGIVKYTDPTTPASAANPLVAGGTIGVRPTGTTTPGAGAPRAGGGVAAPGGGGPGGRRTTDRPGSAPRPEPAITGPTLSVPVTYRSAAIRSFQLTQGQASWASSIRARLQGTTWRLAAGGAVTYTAPNSSLSPASGHFTVSGSRVNLRVSRETRVGSVGRNTLSVTGTIQLGRTPVLTLSYHAESTTVAVVNGQTFTSHTVSAYVATVELTTG